MTERCEFYIKGRPLMCKAYHYKGAGLPNIYLHNGVTIEDDPDYGELVTIDNVRGLHRAIGLRIIEKHSPMTGAEFRFLRKQMKLTQNELAEHMRVSYQTIANYEKGKVAALGPADPHMRILYLLHVVPPESRAQLIKVAADAIASCSSEPVVPELPRRKIVDGWQDRCLAACA